jgi:hypothetical protein
MTSNIPSIMTIGFWIPALIAILFSPRLVAYIYKCNRENSWSPLLYLSSLFLLSGTATFFLTKKIEGGISLHFIPFVIAMIVCIALHMLHPQATNKKIVFPPFPVVYIFAFTSMVLVDFIECARMLDHARVGGAGWSDGLIVLFLLPSIALVLLYECGLAFGWGGQHEPGFSWKRYLKYAFSPVE